MIELLQSDIGITWGQFGVCFILAVMVATLIWAVIVALICDCDCKCHRWDLSVKIARRLLGKSLARHQK